MSTYTDLAKIEGLSAHGTFRDYPVWRHTLALPPQPLMGSTGTDDPAIFMIVGHAWAQVASHYAQAGASVLDIGCGCGKTARFLTMNQNIVQYTGFDVLKICIDWAERYIGVPTNGRFRFEHADIANQMYNPHGGTKPHAFRFPAKNASIDIAIAASLFTHLLEADCAHYLSELARVLTPPGKALISIHIEPEAGTRYSGTEARIDIEPSYFESLANDAGLVVHERPGDLCGQELFVLTKA